MIRLPITLALAAVVFAFPVSADALGANVVPNAGFEQGGCGASTPIICGWQGSSGYMSQVGSPGSYSMSLDCGPLGCYGSEYGASLEARTAPAFCAAIGPGAHPASFVGSTSGDAVHFSAYFYSGADCTGMVGSDALATDAPYATLVSGVLVAPPGTQSVLFSVDAYTSSDCSDYCWFGASFADLDLEDAVTTAPAISSFAPASGPVGTSVDILGWGFGDATSVEFNGIAASYTVDSDREIHAVVPSGAATGPITVKGSGGTGISTSSFTVTGPPPTISSFTPSSGPVGSIVDIRGSHFTEATSVMLGNSGGLFTVVSDSEIQVTVPNSTPAATGPVSVTTPSGTATTSSSFEVTGVAPTISSFTPTSGPAGTSVDVHGSNFNYATSVTFGAVAASFTVDSDTEIHATVPTRATTGPISITTPNGTGTSSSAFTVNAETTPPDTTITSGPPSTTTSSSATFHFTANGPSMFECSLDAAAFDACSSPASYTGLAAGSHTFRVRAIGSDGNADPTPAQQTWIVVPNSPPTASFTLSCSALTCRFDASGSSDSDGTIASYAWDFGDGTSAVDKTTSHTFAHAGTYTVELTVTDNGGATAGTSMQVAAINIPPTASYTVSCTGLSCALDGSGSSDSDGTIASYAWDFGDGSSAGGKTTSHTYARAGIYTATLTVTDNTGATASQTKTVTAIGLSARGYRVKTIERVDLSWNGPTGAGFDVYRNAARVATVQANAYTDNLGKKGSGTYTYNVCAVALSACSNQVTVSFTATGATTRAARPAQSGRVHRGRRHHRPIWITHRGKKR